MTDPRAPALLAALGFLEEGEAAADTYQRLDDHLPHLSDLFVLDRHFFVRGSMLQSAFECIVDYAEGGVQYRLSLASTRVNHEIYDLSDDVFLSFFDVISEGLKKSLEAHWDEAVEQDWQAMLAHFNQILANA